jgi:transposase IS605 orfB
MAPRKPHTKDLDDEARLAKNKRIAQTQKETKRRRKNMDVLVRTVKIQRNKLSSSQREKLDRLFLEGKWLYNTALAHNQFNEKFRKSLNHTVEVKLPNGEVELRNLETLGGQLQQGILERMRNNLKGLAALKKKGRRVGGLKFTSEMNSIPLVQFGKTHKIRGSKVKIANIPGWMRVKGLNQFTNTDEFSSAVLIRKGEDFFVAFTIYRNKDEHSSLATKKFIPDTTIGLDMGVSTHITFSDGSSVTARVEEPDRLKRLSRKLARQKKGSKAFMQTKELIGDEHRKVVNKRNDAANKVSSWILEHEHIFMQDENISAWRRKHSVARGSRSIQYGILGRVKTRLVDHPRVTVLKKNVATTATCICGEKTPHSLDKRTFFCPICGYSAPRDLHAAKNMYRLATKENIKE